MGVLACYPAAIMCRATSARSGPCSYRLPLEAPCDRPATAHVARIPLARESLTVSLRNIVVMESTIA
ncbi:hypothetical protein GCM10023225_09030 [Kineococcus glutinatus]|uniref:Uncharacterized protein n=1 Tax=Kineococcus glutinatus TaxID=1070872 RepID=A0ABP9HEE0_9ACTN